MKKIHILPRLREGILKKIIFTLFHVRGHGSFPGLIFNIQDMENEPPVLKEIPPLKVVHKKELSLVLDI